SYPSRPAVRLTARPVRRSSTATGESRMRFLSLFGALSLVAAPAAGAQSPSQASAPPGWTIVIHGGAGTIERDRRTPEQDKEIRAALGRAIDAGSAVLAAKGSSLDAVEAAIKVLEDDPH